MNIGSQNITVYAASKKVNKKMQLRGKHANMREPRVAIYTLFTTSSPLVFRPQIPMSVACDSNVLVCDSYVNRMNSYVTSMYSYVTRMYAKVTS